MRVFVLLRRCLCFWHVMWLDPIKDMFIHVWTCTSYEFNAL